MSEKNERREQEVPVKPGIPLKHIRFEARVKGAFAHVKCTQQFENKGTNPVEAVYVFPVPEDASVIGCKMQIGRRRVEATLKKAAEARAEYDTAVAGGHHAALLEQDRPNIFTMNVGGIEPGEQISVEVVYVQRVPWQAGGGRFTIPLVVAPRFIPGIPTGKQGGGWAPDTDEVPDASRITPVVAKEGVPYNADIKVHFQPGVRCQVSCPSHNTIIEERVVARGEKVELNTGDILTSKDFILVYSPVSKVPEVAVHLGNSGSERFVLSTIFPPGGTVPVGSDIVMVLDCSGSMNGAKNSGLKVIASKVVDKLGKQNVGHRVGIVPFDDHPWSAHPISEVNDDTRKFIGGLQARGGTRLGLALDAAARMLQQTEAARPKVIMMVTDGQTEDGRNWNGNGIRLIAVGIDTAVNDEVINQLARRNLGVSEFVFPGEDYDAVANRLSGYLSGPVLREVKVDAKGADVVGVSDVFEGRPATIALRFTGKPGLVKISGLNQDGRLNEFAVEPGGAEECDFAAQVWARDFIRVNQDQDKQTEASLKYGVICKHTSFVAVSLKDVAGKPPERIEIPVNLPAGWDYDAVFGGVDARLGFAVAASAIPMIRVLRSCVRTRDSGITLESINCYRGVVDDVSLAERGVPASKGGPSEAARHRRSIIEVVKDSARSIVDAGKTKKAGNRFALDATDLVDRMVAILNAAAVGDMDGAEKAFKSIKRELNAAAIKKLTEDKRAMALYFVLRLESFGLALDHGVRALLDVKPSSAMVAALSWYNLALREMGKPYARTVPVCPEASYLNWKFGSGPKPDATAGDWYQVA